LVPPLTPAPPVPAIARTGDSTGIIHLSGAYGTIPNSLARRIASVRRRVFSR
jgi:hypothetical protein